MAGFSVIATIATITTDKAEQSLRSGVSIRSPRSTLQRWGSFLEAPDNYRAR